MFNLSKVAMRRLVKFNSALLLNPKCPIWLQRAGLNMLGGFGILPESTTIEKLKLAGMDAWWFNNSTQKPKQVVLYFHGGGYSVGSPRSHRDLCAYLAHYAETSVVSVAYRLAPEHPYPAAVEDAIASYQALIELGYTADDIVLAGDSAGGSLALTLAIQLKQQSQPQPAGMFLISPLVNKKRSTKSYVTQYDVDPVISHRWSHQMAKNYLNHSAELIDQACLSDKDLTGIAPMLIHVGTDEVLLDDSLTLKQRATQSGNHVKLVTFPELWHVFHFSASIFVEARKALQQAGNEIKQFFKTRSNS